MKEKKIAWLVTHDAYIDRRILFFADVLMENGYSCLLYTSSPPASTAALPRGCPLRRITPLWSGAENWVSFQSMYRLSRSPG